MDQIERQLKRLVSDGVRIHSATWVYCYRIDSVLGNHPLSIKDAGVQVEALRFPEELEGDFRNQEVLSSECQLQDFEPFTL